MGLTLSTITRIGATLSSTETSASLCIDDDTANYCSSMKSTSPWLSIQLPSAATVSYVVLHHREDCCQGELAPLQVWVGSSEADHATSTSSHCGNANVVAINQGAPDSGYFAFRCADAQGNALTSAPGSSGTFVTVVLPGGDRQLHLAEVQILGQVLNIVSTSFVVEESIESFNQTAFEESLLEEYPDATSVTGTRTSLYGETLCTLSPRRPARAPGGRASTP